MADGYAPQLQSFMASSRAPESCQMNRDGVRGGFAPCQLPASGEARAAHDRTDLALHGTSERAISSPTALDEAIDISLQPQKRRLMRIDHVA